MAFVTVWKFDSPGGATGAATRLDTLTIEGAGHVADGAVVEWAETRGKPSLSPFKGRGNEGALGGKFWHTLFDVLLSDSGTGNHASSLSEAGFDDDALDRIRAGMTKGSSTLFLIAEQGDRERVLEAFGGPSRYVHLIHSNLPQDQEAQLRADFTKA
jgi:uncharacterized membrane protein